MISVSARVDHLGSVLVEVPVRQDVLFRSPCFLHRGVGNFVVELVPLRETERFSQVGHMGGPGRLRFLENIDVEESGFALPEVRTGLEIDTESRSVTVDDKPVELTSMEYELLLILARRQGRNLSRDDILSELRGIDVAILTRSVDIMISRLRQKLGDQVKPPRFIQTVWGRGYTFVGTPRQNA